MGDLRLDLPASEEQRLRAIARLKAVRADNERRYSAHPWPYLCEAVYTFNPLRKGRDGGGVQKYPGALIHDRTPSCPCTPGGCQNYLHHLVNMLVQYPRMAVPKSRRLLVSWTLVAFYEWLARYRDGQVIAFVSRKQGQNEEEGSAELVKRARFIGEHLPAEVQPREVKSTWCRLTYPHNGSVIVGIAQGANQIRQLTVTAWFGDEFAFWEQAGPTYDASVPALEGGGRVTLVSTPNPGYMQKLVTDAWEVGGGY